MRKIRKDLIISKTEFFKVFFSISSPFAISIFTPILLFRYALNLFPIYCFKNLNQDCRNFCYVPKILRNSSRFRKFQKKKYKILENFHTRKIMSKMLFILQMHCISKNFSTSTAPLQIALNSSPQLHFDAKNYHRNTLDYLKWTLPSEKVETLVQIMSENNLRKGGWWVERKLSQRGNKFTALSFPRQRQEPSKR